MRVAPERGPWAQVLTVLLAFATGPALGVGLARLMTPESALLEVLSPVAFVLVFIAGLMAWMGLGIAAVVGAALWDLVRGRGLRRGRGAAEGGRLVPPGYRAFAILGPVAGCLVGVAAGLATELSVWVAVGAWGVAGLGYGLALRAAAHHGYLPFPEPE